MLKVLLVDDEKTLLEATSIYLKRKENIETEFSFSPSEARLKMEGQKFYNHLSFIYNLGQMIYFI